MLRSYARQDSQNYASSLREQIGGRPPYPGRAFARRQISRSLMLLRDRTGSKRRADLCRANRRAAAAFRSLVLQRGAEDVLPRRLLRKARKNDEAKIDIDRPSPTESTRLPCTGKIPPRRHASAGCIPASADTCKVRYQTRRFVVSSTKFHPRRPAFMFLRSRIVRTLHLARQRLSEAVRGRLFPCRATRTQSGPLSLSAKIRRATTSGQPQSHRIIVRVASKRLLAAHERAALDERPIAPNKQVADKRHAEF